MQKTDLAELKKTLKADKVTINKIAGCYANGEGNIIHKFSQNFLTLNEREQFKYLEMLKKMMSAKIDDTLQTLPVENEECKKMFASLRTSKLEQDGLIDTFYRNVLEHADYPNGFSIFIFYSAYDIPEKGSDKKYQGESDEVYTSIYGIVCPTETSIPCLSYDPEKDCIETNKVQKTIGMPDVGFIYPDFNDRSEDTDKVVYSICNKKDVYPNFAQDVLGCQRGLTAKEQKDAFTEALTEAIGEEDVDLVSTIMDELAERAVNAEVNESPLVNAKEISVILTANGLKEEKAKTFEQAYKAVAGTANITIKNVIEAKKKTYKNPAITINVIPEKKNLIRTERRDGRHCLVIDMESSVEINGVPCEV